jgi:hypothetical protein
MHWLAAPAIGAATKLIGGMFQKPKYKQPDTGWLNRFINNNKADLAKKDTFALMNTMGQRNIGNSSRRIKEQIEYNSAKTGMTGSGAESAAILSAEGQIRDASKRVSDEAILAQRNEDRGFRDKIDRAIEMKERIISQSKEAHEAAEENWSNQMKGVVVSSLGDIATAGVQNHFATKGAFEQAKAGGLLDETVSEPLGYETAWEQGLIPDALSEADYGMNPMTAERAYGFRDFTGNMKKAGFSDAGAYAKSLGMDLKESQNANYLDKLGGLLGVDVSNHTGMSDSQRLNLMKIEHDMMEDDAKLSGQYNLWQEQFGDLVPTVSSEFNELQNIGDMLKAGAITYQQAVNASKNFLPADPQTTKVITYDKEGVQHTKDVPQINNYTQIKHPAPKTTKVITYDKEGVQHTKDVPQINNYTQIKHPAPKTGGSEAEADRQRKGEIAFANIKHTAKIYEKYEGENTKGSGKKMQEAMVAAGEGKMDYSTASEILREYAFGLDLPVSASGFHMKAPDGWEMSSGGGDPKDLMFKARKMLYDKLNNDLGKLFTGKNYDPSMEVVKDSKDFEW